MTRLLLYQLLFLALAFSLHTTRAGQVFSETREPAALPQSYGHCVSFRGHVGVVTVEVGVRGY